MDSFRLAGRVVEPALNRIDGVSIEPKVMQVLVALAARPGEVVTRDELMSSAWAGVFVTDDVLHRAVREIRRSFGDDAETSRVVETIRKRGYRLVAPVEPVSTAIADEPPAPTGAWTPGPLAMLVLLAVAAAGGALLVWLGIGRHAAPTTEAHMRFVPLTTDPGNEVLPALSPDGKQLAYVARAADGQSRVFVKAAAGGAAAPLTAGSGRDTMPAWSADGTRVAYAHIEGERCTIRVMDVASRSTRDLGRCADGDAREMSWSADGRSLAVASRIPGGPYRIELLDLADLTRTPITDPPPGTVGDTTAAFSPDGTRVAFLRSISGSVGDLFVVPAHGGTPARVTTDNADVIGLAWDADGEHLVFSSDREGGINLFRVAVSGGAPVLITGGGAKLKHPSVSRSGAIAFESWHYDINIVDAAIAGGERRPLSPTTDQWNFDPQISPDGSRIAFQSTRSGPYELWVADRDGGHATPVTGGGGYKSVARWSPDGQQLVFVGRPRGAAELTVVDVGTRALRVLGTSAEGMAAPSFSGDGRAVYFSAPSAGRWQVWRMPLDGGESRAVIADAYAAIESLDGRWLYFSRFGRRGLWRRKVAGGDEQIVSPELAPEDWANWGVFDGGAFFVTRPDDDDPLLTTSNGSGQPRALMRLAEHAWSGVTMSRDGSHVLWAHADHRDANIVGIQFVR